MKTLLLVAVHLFSSLTYMLNVLSFLKSAIEPCNLLYPFTGSTQFARMRVELVILSETAVMTSLKCITCN